MACKTESSRLPDTRAAKHADTTDPWPTPGAFLCSTGTLTPMDYLAQPQNPKTLATYTF